MNNKKTLVMGIVIALLVIVICVMGGLLLKQNKKKDGNMNASESGQTVAEQADAGSDTEAASDNTRADNKSGNDDKEDKISQDEKKSGTADYYVEIGHDGTWDSEGKTCATENINIYNRTSAGVTGWKLDVVYKGDPAIENIWNGEKKINKNKVSITPADYNQEIPAGGSVNVGYNIAADDLSVVDYVLYIDGKEYDREYCENGKPSGNLSDENSDVKKEAAADGDKKTSDKKNSADKETVVSGGTSGSEDKNGTPFADHGQLSVKGTDIVDDSGKKYQLKGVSTHGITWFPDYVNKSAFQSIRDDWGANLVRLAMYTDTGDSNGYCSGGDKDSIKKLVDEGVSAATELGMYVIVDWHILNDNDPNTHIDDAKEFFGDVSAKYSSNHNVIYEICNEPNGGTSWADIKSYAETIIPVIRENDKNAIIIVGTPNWSQDVDIVSDDPITGYDNIMYAVHFYAATHKDDLRNKVKTAISNGLPVFVSEFSLCDASGNGEIDYDSSDAWFELINDNDLSYASWSLCNKNETSALLRPESQDASDITVDDLSDTGKYVREKIQGN